MLHCNRQTLKQTYCFAIVTSCYGHPMTNFFSKVIPSEQKEPKLSMTIGINRLLLAKSIYLLYFPFAASSAAVPTDYKVTEMYDIAVMSAMVMSQTV